ncbi:hypothetical protein D9615_000426 [Tricholomella constricta]|uniref:Uncharacterized protein n=1 Tax=Tricholomella constricta TaxID=117010 RepID=A0A8H5MBT4_9AGAR|nr:hypothetical protein D9615_000426 [Tricholomella constricta]
MPVSGDSFASISSLSTPPSSTSMDPLKPTDFSSFVVQVLAHSTRESPVLDQRVLRQCLGLSSSFLVTDSTTNPDTGINTWTVGFTRLVDVLVALHARNELELETVNAASRACSECWSASGSWRSLAECREGVRIVATKLKKLLDPNGRTYRGQPVYAP